MKKKTLTQTIKIKDLGKVITGTTPPTANKAYFDGKYLFIKPSDISEDQRYLFETEITLSDAGYEYQAIKALPKNSICVVCIGTIGKKMCLTSQECFTNQQINSIVVNHSKYDQLYVYYLIRNYLPHLKQLNAGSTSGRENVNKSSFENIEIQVHELKIQQKIASILSNYDDLIENNTRRIKILEEMAQTLYNEWFVKFRFPGHEQVRMVESELGLIPEGWEVKELGDIAQEVRRGINPDTVDPETPYFGLEHLPRKSIALSEWGKAGEVQSTKLVFYKGEILFGKIRPYFHKVGVAPIDGICSSDTIVINPKISQYFSIVLSCVSSEDFINHTTQTSQGTKMPRANWDILTKYPLVIPSSSILEQFNNFIENAVQQIQILIFKNKNLQKTRDLLLPKLISGEIDVEKLEIDTEKIAA
ncbi:restriction endonuclease subunit S [Anabaena catenula]|uniref:Restriction endonuclease subunit S n=1 Tax=Anabaena catenula FACHB-362 TaxID=2692877 RepID=A0ABR8J3B8_9NOST|nr:restriction endonuclease subunit S [Anabaena catenula]MBD2692852.1 restriction endonuclease subunit S [Anabaena catenula FACHB-362]